MELVREQGRLVPVLPPQFPFRVSSRPGCGRSLVAAREIRPGETVLTDSAILLGPASAVVCIVCCTKRGRLLRSPGCGHVLCKVCEAADLHTEEECRALAKIGNTPGMFNIILPVRFGLLKTRDPEMFEWLLQFMDHNQERNLNPEMRESNERMTSLLASAVPGVSKEMAWRLVGILFTNCFEFRISNIDARALYPLVSLVNHSCIPNLRHTNLINKLETFSDVKTENDSQGDPGLSHEGGEIVVMQLEAARTILPDTELTIRYNDYMMVGQMRKICLFNSFKRFSEPDSASQVLVRAVVF